MLSKTANGTCQIQARNNEVATIVDCKMAAKSSAQLTAWQNIICLKHYLSLTLIVIQYGLKTHRFFAQLLSASASLFALTLVANIAHQKRRHCREQQQRKANGQREDVNSFLLDYAIDKSNQDEPLNREKQCVMLFNSVDSAINNNKIVCQGFDRVSKLQSEKIKRSGQSKLLLSSIIVILASCLNDTPSCYCFGLFEHDYNSANYYNTPEHQLIPLQSIRNHARQLNYNPFAMTIMPNNPASLSLDQSSDEPSASPPTTAHSWTSIFNPFSANSNSNNNNNNNNGQSQPSNDSLNRHIRKILVPRVSGTQGNIGVRQYIVDVLKKNNYHTELDEFTDSTPIGNVNFANIIASSNPKACRQLVLACHYDSKMMNGFLGATDSAVPCAMLLKIAETFNESYRQSDSSDTAKDDIGLRFIFFDGEEAFVQWTRTDSLYGSRHLAAKWAKQAAPQECRRNFESQKKTELDRIDLFVLLDLIGTSDTTFVQYNSSVKRHYESLQKYERDHILKSKPDLSQSQLRRETAFRSKSLSLDFVEDDHVPFKQHGVPILLLLAHPFPRVWHTVADNYSAIDFARTRRVQHALEEFVANYS